MLVQKEKRSKKNILQDSYFNWIAFRKSIIYISITIKGWSKRIFKYVYKDSIVFGV